MRESLNNKRAGITAYENGYEDCYETHKEYLKWQKLEDVELEDGKMYLIKKDNEIPFVAYWDKKTDGFLKAIFNPEMDSLYSRYNLLIKKI